jgi:hypothetical protein
MDPIIKRIGIFLYTVLMILAAGGAIAFTGWLGLGQFVGGFCSGNLFLFWLASVVWYLLSD